MHLVHVVWRSFKDGDAPVPRLVFESAIFANIPFVILGGKYNRVLAIIIVVLGCGRYLP